MAYRTFHEEPSYAAPDIDYFPKTIALLQTAALQRQKQQQNNRQLAATYQADKLASKFTTDQEDLNHLSASLTQEATSDLKNYGILSPQTRDKQSRGLGYKALSDAQWQMKEDLEKSVKDRVIKGPKSEKNYYIPAHDQQQVINASYGDHENPEDRVNWQNRGERLQKVGESIGKNYINSFDKDAFVNDYVDEQKTQMRSKDSKNTSGVKTGNKVTAVFFDENGVPKVTDKHAIDFLDSSPDIKQRYQQEVDLELMDDLRKMNAKGVEWTKDISPAEAIKKLREDPSLNTESKIKPGERERDLAKKDLERRQKINLDNSYDAGSAEPGHERGLTSKDYGLENSYNKNDFGGPGGVFINKKTGTKGIPIKIGRAFDKTSGTITGNDKSTRTLFADSFNLLPVDNKTGKAIQIPGQSVDDQIKAINEAPDDFFKDVSLETVVHGKSYNTSDLDKSRQEYQELKLTPEDQMNPEQRMRFGELGATLQELDMNPELAPEIIKKKLGVEVEDILKPIKPGTNEAKEIRGKLGTFDITDPKNHDDDQKRLVAAFNKRKREAEASQYGIQEKNQRYKDNVEKIQKLTGKLPTVGTQEDYDKLPAGSEYLGPDGTKRKKK